MLPVIRLFSISDSPPLRQKVSKVLMLQKYMERVDALSLRERGIMLAVILGLLWGAWDAWFMQPLGARQQGLENRISSLKKEIAGANAQVKFQVATRSRDPDIENRAQLAVLRKEAAKLSTALQKFASRLVPPGEMAEVLQAVVNRGGGLHLMRLRGLGAQPLLAPIAKKAKVEKPVVTAPELSLYKHGLEAVFAGGYLEILGYFRALEALPWHFLWERVSLDVQNHPQTETALAVYSVSLDEGWIGL